MAIVLGVALGLVAAWAGLIFALLVLRPKGVVLKDAFRILPDTVRLLRRLAADTSLPRGVHVRLWLLLAYLAFPLDLVPDFIPVLGHADDVIVVVAVLRSVVRRAGGEAVRRHWPGSEAGLSVLLRLTLARGS